MTPNKRNNPRLGDLEIRAALKTFLAVQSGPDDYVVEELGLRRGQARLDVALINGSIHGYEIKSDRDSVRRLAGQVQLYNSVVDRATLVTGPKTLRNARPMIPRWWGIILALPDSNGPILKQLRRARINPNRDLRTLVELLWLGEAVELLQQNGFHRGLHGKPCRKIWDMIVEQLDEELVAENVRDKLKARAMNRIPQKPSKCDGSFQSVARR